MMTLILIILIIILFICMFYADQYRNYRYFHSTIKELSDNFPLFCKYIDRYYITNLPYTIVICLIYFISNFLIFLIIRYLLLGQISILLKWEPELISYSAIGLVFINYLLFICCLILYKVILQILFYLEILKLRVYVNQFNYFHIIKDILVFDYIKFILGFMWMFFYRLATKSYDPDFFEKHIDEWHSAQLDYEEFTYVKIYRLKYIQWFGNKMLYLINKYNIFAIIFLKLSIIIEIIYYYWDYTNIKHFAYIGVFLTLLYDIINHELYYLYYASFIFFIYYIFSAFYNFEQSLCILYTLVAYFYEGESYKVERIFIKNEPNYSLNLSKSVNYNLKKDYEQFDQFIAHVSNNLQHAHKPSIRLEEKFIWIRVYIILLLVITYFILKSLIISVKINIFNITLSTNLLILILLVIIIYCQFKITNRIMYYKRELDPISPPNFCAGYNHNKTYSFIYWVITITILCIYSIIIRNELVFLDDEIIFELPYKVIQITKVYTINEKINFLYQYFEYYIIAYKDLKDLELRYILRQIDFISLIDFNVTIKDIKVYIKLLLETYQLHERFEELVQENLILYLNQTYKPNNGWYNLVRNFILLSAIISTIIYFKNLYLLMKEVNTLLGSHNLIKRILFSFHKSRIPPKYFYNYILEMFEKLKSWW